MSDPVIRFSSPDSGISVTVDEGEMVILTAPPGSGTSAALRALAGEEQAGAGEATIGGEEPGSMSHRRRRRFRQSLRLFHLPHDPPLISNLTVMENLLLPSAFLGESPQDETAREGLMLLDAAGVGWAAGMLPGRIPPEARKAVALVRGFLRRPRVALLDDPMADLDEAGLAGIRSLLRGTLAARHCAILVAARDLDPFEGIDYRRVEMGAAGTPDGTGGEEPA